MTYKEQTPAAFHLGKYYRANRKLEPDGLDRVLDCAEPAVLAGMDVAMIPGEEENIRIVTPIDLERFKLFLNA